MASCSVIPRIPRLRFAALGMTALADCLEILSECAASRRIDALPSAHTVPLTMKTLTTFAVALVLSAFTAVASSQFPDISHDELKQAMKEKKVTLIDVNGSESYAKGHIPGAIDFTANEDKLAANLPKDKAALVVAYCGNERCKAYQQAAIKAKEMGYTNVKHYSKGIAGWKSSGEKTEPGA